MKLKVLLLCAVLVSLPACGNTSTSRATPAHDALRQTGPLTRPYGEWPSPVSAKSLAEGTGGYSEIQWSTDSLYWLESRPEEDGRSVVMSRTSDGTVQQLTPAGFNVRTRVHEYGGGAYLAHQNTVWFSNFDDQRLYRQQAGSRPVPITPAKDYRYSECLMDRQRNRLLCIREDHTVEGEARNELVSLAPDPVEVDANAGTVVFSGTDFVINPTLSPNGNRLAFITWNHPNMPWDNVHLRVAELDQSGTITSSLIVNANVNEAIYQPRWKNNSTLYFVSDRDNWWNFYRYHNDTVERVNDDSLEMAVPQWWMGSRTWFFTEAGDIISLVNRRGREGLVRVDAKTGKLAPLPLDIVDVNSVATDGKQIFANVGFPARSPAVVSIKIEDNSLNILQGGSLPDIATNSLSLPEYLAFPTSGDEEAHGFYYPPANAEVAGPSGTLPPLILIAHGGPTAHTTPTFSKAIQFWTSRGFAIFDLNYRGSSGFGRDYRLALYGALGKMDVQDAVAAARYLVSQGKVDGERLIIRGASAGGFMVLAALAFHDAFDAGANYFGVSDLETLTQHTHKFESRFLDTLVAPYPERRDVYLQRSPIYNLAGFSEPLITFQGLEDRVVPHEQSEQIFNALVEKGVPAAYVAFEGEQHGFRKSATIIQTYENELYFYGRIFGFDPAGELRAVEIENPPHIDRKRYVGE